MIRQNKCLNCRLLFSVSYDNRVSFCNAAKGAFIDDYLSRKELYLDFLKSIAKEQDFIRCRKQSDQAMDLSGRNDICDKNYSYQDMLAYSLKRSIGNELLGKGRYYSGKIFCFTNYYCNNNCLHCFGGDKARRKNFPLNDLEDMIYDLSREYREIHFGGGEPTLFKDLGHIIEFSKKRNLSAWLLTNGRKFSDKNFAKEILDSGLDAMIICLHSHAKEIHDSITQRLGSFQETITGIRNLKQLGFKNIHIIVIVHKKNYKDLKATVGFLAKEGVGEVAFESLVYVGNAAKNIETLGVKLTDTVRYIQDALDILIERNIKIRLTSFPLCLFKSCYWKYFINRRYEVLATNFPHGDGNGLYHKYKTSGLRLSAKCIECRLKTFCAGAWESYYHFYGEEEFNPIRNITNEKMLGLVSGHSLNFALCSIN